MAWPKWDLVGGRAVSVAARTVYLVSCLRATGNRGGEERKQDPSVQCSRCGRPWICLQCESTSQRGRLCLLLAGIFDARLAGLPNEDEDEGVVVDRCGSLKDVDVRGDRFQPPSRSCE